MKKEEILKQLEKMLDGDWRCEIIKEKNSTIIQFEKYTTAEEAAETVNLAEEEVETVNLAEEEIDNEKLIAEKLQEIGVPAHLKGYKYLNDAISMVLEDSSNIQGITKILYPNIAKKNQTTASKVERAMRHAIEVAWEKSRQKGVENCLGYTMSRFRHKPTNSEFIATMAERMRCKLPII